MNRFILLQTSEKVLVKSAEMLEKDPHGAIITIVSVAVVFLALFILWGAYELIGKLSSGQIKFPEWRKKKAVKPADAHGKPGDEVAAAIALALDQEMNGEVYAAIGTALHLYMNDTVHDLESYVITIKRKR